MTWPLLDEEVALVEAAFSAELVFDDDVDEEVDEEVEEELEEVVPDDVVLVVLELLVAASAVCLPELLAAAT